MVGTSEGVHNALFHDLNGGHLGLPTVWQFSRLYIFEAMNFSVYV